MTRFWVILVGVVQWGIWWFWWGFRFFSVGEGGVFPAGLYLGEVKAYMVKDVSGEAVVQSAVDFALLEDVFIVHMDDSPGHP